jgi:hypothetical protein
VVLAVELPRLFALSEPGPRAGGQKNAADARASGPQAFGQNALGHDFQLQLARLPQLLHRAAVFRMKWQGRDHLLDLSLGNQIGDTELARSLDPSSLADQSQVANPNLGQPTQQFLRHSASGVAGNQHGSAIGDAFQS